MRDWATELGMLYETVKWRHRMGFSIERVLSPVRFNRWDKIKTPFQAVIVSLCLILLAGCGAGSLKSMGISRRPIIEFIPPEDFKSDEREFLIKWHGDNPALFEKLQKHNNKLAKAIQAYNEDAISINLKQVELVSDGDKDSAKAAVRVQIQKAKYPPLHPIYKLVGEEKP